MPKRRWFWGGFLSLKNPEVYLGSSQLFVGSLYQDLFMAVNWVVSKSKLSRNTGTFLRCFFWFHTREKPLKGMVLSENYSGIKGKPAEKTKKKGT